jgi:hypothetical protein
MGLMELYPGCVIALSRTAKQRDNNARDDYEITVADHTSG